MKRNVNGVGDVDAGAFRPHFLNIETRLRHGAPRFANMTWGRRCRVFSEDNCETINVLSIPVLSRFCTFSGGLCLRRRSRSDRGPVPIGGVFAEPPPTVATAAACAKTSRRRQVRPRTCYRRPARGGERRWRMGVGARTASALLSERELPRFSCNVGGGGGAGDGGAGGGRGRR